MVKSEWGLKRVCPSCGARYYDMQHDPIICPKCGAAYETDTNLKSRRAKAPPPAEVPIEPIAEEEIEADLAPEEAEAEEGEEIAIEGGEEVEGEEEEEEEVIEDASELGEDEDDMAEVIENVEDEEER
jgi:uncharacterized protein (TIGR02300 family)